MKVILSRKGFDSEFGGGPSPILPDGSMRSLPIPSPGDAVSYGRLRCDDGSYQHLMEQLGYEVDHPCHLDPDLEPDVVDRHPDWRPLFGQVDAAQGHLANQGVGPGDLFLFFGWFRRTRSRSGRLEFDPEDRAGRHVLFGYLEVEAVVPVQTETALPSWMEYHPHAAPSRRARRNNVIYVARPALSWNPGLPGAGTFRFGDALALTAPGHPRSRWALPDCFRGVAISYHSDRSWRASYFQSAAKGQEFVVEASDAVAGWARDLIERHQP
ncbi:MAG: hypothetical protein ACOY94_28330 [Bacillota bacterium]